MCDNMNAEIVRNFRCLGVTDEQFLAVVMVWPLNRIHALGDIYIQVKIAVGEQINLQNHEEMFMLPLRRHVCRAIGILHYSQFMCFYAFCKCYLAHYYKGKPGSFLQTCMIVKAHSLYSQMYDFPDLLPSKELKKRKRSIEARKLKKLKKSEE